MHTNHAFYPLYQQAYEILSQFNEHNTNNANLAIYLHYISTTNRHRYNLPTADEIAILLPGDGFIPQAMRNIVFRLRDNPLECIHEEHPAYLPLHYVLFSLW